MSVRAKSLELVDPASLLISHSDYSGKTPSEARRAIKVKLDDYNFAVSLERIDKQKINATLNGETMPPFMETLAQMEGVALVRAYYDGTPNTGAIKTGHQVVVDTVKGNAVTGVHATWSSDEYKIIGVALEDYSTPSVEGKRIAIRLLPSSAIAANEAALFQTHAKTGQSYPSFPTQTPGASIGTRRVFPARKYTNPSYPTTGNPTSLGGGIDVNTDYDLYNIAIQPRWVLEFTEVIGWKIKDQWYMEVVPAPMIYAVLTSDLLLSAFGSYATVSSAQPAMIAPGEKVRSMGIRTGYKYASGTAILAFLLGTEYTVIKAFQCPVPQ